MKLVFGLKVLRAVDLGSKKTPRLKWFQQHQGSSSWKGSIAWCICVNPASVSIGSIFNTPSPRTILRWVSFQ